MPPNPHPLVVHFPIALLSLAVVFELLARFSGRESLLTAAYWNLVVGSMAAAVAVASGLLAESIVPENGPAHEALESHESLAFATLGIFAALFLWRTLRDGEFYRRFSAFFLIAMLVAWIALAATSFYGGELVFHHGVGTQQPKNPE